MLILKKLCTIICQQVFCVTRLIDEHAENYVALWCSSSGTIKVGWDLNSRQVPNLLLERHQKAVIRNDESLLPDHFRRSKWRQPDFWADGHILLPHFALVIMPWGYVERTTCICLLYFYLFYCIFLFRTRKNFILLPMREEFHKKTSWNDLNMWTRLLFWWRWMEKLCFEHHCCSTSAGFLFFHCNSFLHFRNRIFLTKKIVLQGSLSFGMRRLIQNRPFQTCI